MAKGNICRIDGCNKVLNSVEGQVCRKHRSRFSRHGNYDISPNWTMNKKGKPCLTKYGYLRINIDGNRVQQHRYLMEQHLGRPLTKTENIHHINGDKTDNRIENLELMISNSEHLTKYHRDNRKRIVDWSKYLVPQNNKQKVCIIIGCELKTRSRCLCIKHMQSFYHNRYHKT